MRYKVTATRKGIRSESEALGSLDAARSLAEREAKTAKVVTILEDREGTDHPDNAGKFFLHTIVK